MSIEVDAEAGQDDRGSSQGFLKFEMFLWICDEAFGFRHVVRLFSVECIRTVRSSLSISLVDNQRSFLETALALALFLSGMFPIQFCRCPVL
jgi:hypothetical protein